MSEPRTYQFDDFTLDARRRELSKGGAPRALQPRAFDALVYLVEHHDRVATKDELLQQVWGRAAISENVLSRAISLIRKALDDDARAPRYVRAVRGVGYRFVGPLRSEETPDAGASDRTIAVLPVTNRSPRTVSEPLAESLGECMASALSQLSAVVVRPYASVAQSGDGQSDPLLIAHEQRVDYLVESSLEFGAEGALRMRVSLVSVPARQVLRARTFDHQPPVNFRFQDRLGQGVVALVADAFGIAPARRPSRRVQGGEESYAHYLRGRVFRERHTPQDIRRAITSFEAALDSDPTSADSWAALAECHELLGTLGGDTGACYEAARRAARRALALDPDLPEALCCSARIAWQYDWDWSGARRAFDAAIERFPQRADLHIGLSDFASMTGRQDDAVAHARAALRIDPVSPWVNSMLAQALYMSGAYEQAAGQARATLELAPEFPFASFFLGLSLSLAEDVGAGIGYVRQAADSGREDFVSAMALLLARSGQRAAAERILDRITANHEVTPPIAPAMVLLGLDRVGEAVPYLDAALARRDWHLLLLYSDPLFADFRNLPEIRRVIAALKLPTPLEPGAGAG